MIKTCIYLIILPNKAVTYINMMLAILESITDML